MTSIADALQQHLTPSVHWADQRTDRSESRRHVERRGDGAACVRTDPVNECRPRLERGEC